jgi:hypothetical protein
MLIQFIPFMIISITIAMNVHTFKHNLICSQDLNIKNTYLRWLLSHATQKRKRRLNIIRRYVVRNACLRQPDMEVLKNVVTSKAIDSVYAWSYKYYTLTKAESDFIEFIISSIN